MLREATRVDPSRPEGHVQLARAYRVKGLLNDAARELKLAAPGTSGTLAALYRTSRWTITSKRDCCAWRRDGSTVRCRRFEKVLTLDARHAVAQRSLAEARKRLRERTTKNAPGPPK